MQVIQGALTDDGASQSIYIEPGETLTAVLTIADAEAFEGFVSIERSRDGVNFAPALSAAGVSLVFEGTDAVELTGSVFSGTLTNDDSKRNAYRVRATGVAQDGVSYALTELLGDRITILLRDRNGRPVMWALDDGRVEVDGLIAGTVNPAAALATTESLTTNDTTATALDINVYQSVLTTSGSEGSEDATIGDGTGAVIGQRKLVTVAALGHASDDVSLDVANIVDTDGAAVTAVTIDAADGFILLEWNGTAWQVIYSGDATVTPA